MQFHVGLFLEMEISVSGNLGFKIRHQTKRDLLLCRVQYFDKNTFGASNLSGKQSPWTVLGESFRFRAFLGNLWKHGICFVLSRGVAMGTFLEKKVCRLWRYLKSKTSSQNFPDIKFSDISIQFCSHKCCSYNWKQGINEIFGLSWLVKRILPIIGELGA